MTNRPSVRLKTLLDRNDLGLFQAFRKSDKELLAIRNFGRKTLAELREIQLGLDNRPHFWIAAQRAI